MLYRPWPSCCRFIPLVLIVAATACRASIDPPLTGGLQPLPGLNTVPASGLPEAVSPECRAAVAGEIMLNEYLVRPAGIDLDGDGKSNGRDEVIELAVTTGHEPVHLAGARLLVDGVARGQIAGATCLSPQRLAVVVGNTTALVAWPPGTDEVRLDHPLKLPDGGGSLELRSADNQLLFRHAYLAETAGAPSSWTRATDGDEAAAWTRQLDWLDGHGRSHSIGLCNNGQTACACLSSQGMDCSGEDVPGAPAAGSR